MKRRDFLRHTMVVVVGGALPAASLEWLDPREVLASQPDLRWVFLVDTYKCVGCGFCVKACKTGKRNSPWTPTSPAPGSNGMS